MVWNWNSITREYEKITKVLKKWQKIYSETVTNKNHKEIPGDRYTSPEEGQKIIYNLDINIIVK